MTDMDELIQLTSSADPSFLECRPVYACAGADFNIVLDNKSADVTNATMFAVRPSTKTKTICPNDGVGKDCRTFADDNAGIKHGSEMNRGASPYAASVADYRPCHHYHVIAQGDARSYDRSR